MTKILLTTGRAPITLELARQLRAQGHTVFVADTTPFHISRFSNAVERSFCLPSPRYETKEFLKRLRDVIEEYEIELLIPLWEEILYIANHPGSIPPSCKVFSDSFEVLHKLHNKWLFIKLQEELGIKTPETHLIKTTNDLEALDLNKTWILKLAYSRASQNMHKIEPGKALPTIKSYPNNPWIAQEWLEGKKFCSFSIAREGKLKAHTAYPVNFAIDDSSCLNFVAIRHPEIKVWVENFVKKIGFTGNIAFDFIETSKGLYAIECNPRGTSGLHLFKPSDKIDRAYLREFDGVIEPEVGNTKQIFTGMMLYGWKQKSCASFVKQLFDAPDVVFDKGDMVPFFSQPFLIFNHLNWGLRYRVSLPEAFTYDLNWNGEETSG